MSDRSHVPPSQPPSGSAKWRSGLAPAVDSTAGVSREVAATAVPVEMLQGDEEIILLTKPSPLFILITSFRFMLGTVLLGVLAARLFTPVYINAYNVATLAAAVCLGRLVWGLLVWTSHTYMLTNHRIVTIKGVLNVTVTAINLRKVQRTTLQTPLVLRFFGLGSIGIATAATETYDATWLMVSRPIPTHEKIVATIAKVQ